MGRAGLGKYKGLKGDEWDGGTMRGEIQGEIQGDISEGASFNFGGEVFAKKKADKIIKKHEKRTKKE